MNRQKVFYALSAITAFLATQTAALADGRDGYDRNRQGDEHAYYNRDERRDWDHGDNNDRRRDRGNDGDRHWNQGYGGDRHWDGDRWRGDERRWGYEHPRRRFWDDRADRWVYDDFYRDHCHYGWVPDREGNRVVVRLSL